MKSFLVAQRYARGLDRVLADDHEAESLSRDLSDLAQAYEESGALRSVLANPAVPESLRLSILEGILARIGAPEVLRSFAATLLRRRRMDLLPAVAQLFAHESDRRLNRVEADVESSAPLNEAQARRITEALETYTGKQVRVVFSVNPELIGGVCARIEDRILDGSVRTRLKRLREYLLPEEESGG